MYFSKIDPARIGAWLCTIGCLLVPLSLEAQTSTPSEAASIELTNLDLPDTAPPSATADKPAESAASGMVEIQAAPDGKASSESTAREAAQTPMEQYRELKLQQATTPHTVNPASVRRYLKVDRSSYMDSTGVR